MCVCQGRVEGNDLEYFASTENNVMWRSCSSKGVAKPAQMKWRRPRFMEEPLFCCPTTCWSTLPVFRVLNKGLETFALLVMGSRDVLSLQGGNMGYYQTKFGYIGNSCKEFLYVTLAARVSCCSTKAGKTQDGAGKVSEGKGACSRSASWIQTLGLM